MSNAPHIPVHLGSMQEAVQYQVMDHSQHGVSWHFCNFHIANMNKIYMILSGVIYMLNQKKSVSLDIVFIRRICKCICMSVCTCASARAHAHVSHFLSHPDTLSLTLTHTQTFLHTHTQYYIIRVFSQDTCTKTVHNKYSLIKWTRQSNFQVQYSQCKLYMNVSGWFCYIVLRAILY